MPAFSGELLRAARDHEHLTREAVAVATGRTASALAKYESGDAVPSGRTMGQLAAVLRCEVSDFYGPVPDDKRLRTLADRLRSEPSDTR